MNLPPLRDILDQVSRGALPAEEAEQRLLSYLRDFPFEDIGFARVDHHRALRKGFPEVIFGTGKTPAQIAAIAARIVARGHSLLVTRTTEEAYAALAAEVPAATFHPDARAITLRQEDIAPGRGVILVAAAGTADLPVAEEAVVTAEIMGNQVERLYDVGVAGLHRLLGRLADIQQAHVLIVVAGMEGALASVVGGLVSCPVIAVPTSVGYGASFGGIAPLLTMLNSCAAGVSVVNIDNGFGGGYIAALIARGVAPAAEGQE
jgi:NCAIR mutase (PurE)-related protein